MIQRLEIVFSVVMLVLEVTLLAFCRKQDAGQALGEVDGMPLYCTRADGDVVVPLTHK